MKSGPGIRRLVVGLTVQVLVLEEEHRIFAADGGPQETVGIQRRGRTDHPQTRHAGEDGRPGLGVIDRAALQVAAVGDPDDDRRGEGIVRPPPHERQLVPQLHVGGPDVVEELDLDHRLDPACGQADGPADDIRFRQRRVVHPVAAEGTLQAPGDLEDAALALHRRQVLLPAGIGDILAKDDDPRVAGHFVLEAGIEQVDHRGGLAGEARRVLGIERRGGRVNVRGIDPIVDGVERGLRRGKGGIGRQANLLVHPRPDGLEFRLGGQSLGQQIPRERRDRVAQGVCLPLPGGAVEALRHRTGSGCTAGSHWRGPAPDPCVPRQ